MTREALGRGERLLRPVCRTSQITCRSNNGHHWMKRESWEDVLGRFRWEDSVAASTIVIWNPLVLQQDHSHQPSNPTSYDQDMETLSGRASISGPVAIPTNQVASSRRRMKMTSLSPGQRSRNDRHPFKEIPSSHQRRKRKQTTPRLHCLSIVPRQAYALVISSRNRCLR
jgi:hypothetical protein